MTATIDTLSSTTFNGRRFTRKQLIEVQETISTFKNLSFTELAATLCEHLDWRNPAGKLKINSCMEMLEELEALGIVTLPSRRKTEPRIRHAVTFKEEPDRTEINEALAAIGPITLRRIESKEDWEDYKAYVQAHHYLGHKQPFGSYIAYFVYSETKRQRLGCLLFMAAAAYALAPRDKWIGWEEKHRKKLLHLIINNSRFLIFPWVNVPNLASHVLSLAVQQIGDDWVREYKYRPVLLETYVDTTKYTGACYRAANFEYLGQSQGRGHFHYRNKSDESIKEIFVYPLETNFRQILTDCRRKSALNKKYRNDVRTSETRLVDDAFLALWEKVAAIINDVAEEYDAKWQVRRRVINSMLIVLLVFRLVCSKNSQSLGATIDELWENCRKLNLSLPQKSSAAPSSFCVARTKLDEAVFKQINRRIIEAYTTEANDIRYNWHGRRIFAVDGSKLNLPRNLLKNGYKLPSDNSNYPQGLLSCLYQLKSKIPFDFDLVEHADERACAIQHLHTLKETDIVVYDRGYFSYEMLHRHHRTGIDAIFRLQESSYTVIKDFFANQQTDVIVTIYPSSKTQCEIRQKHPELDFIPLSLRLIKYQIAGDTYCLGTTLLDQNRYADIDEFVDIYHERWGIEELYKVSKRLFIIEDFHAKSVRGVKQEIFAHFVLITMNRIFANQAENDLNSIDMDIAESTENSQDFKTPNQFFEKIRVNFKNCIQVFTKSMEELLLLHGRMKSVVNQAFQAIIGRRQKERSGRSYIRKSMKPENKWRSNKDKTKKQSTQVLAPVV